MSEFQFVLSIQLGIVNSVSVCHGHQRHAFKCPHFGCPGGGGTSPQIHTNAVPHQSLQYHSLSQRPKKKASDQVGAAAPGREGCGTKPAWILEWEGR